MAAGRSVAPRRCAGRFTASRARVGIPQQRMGGARLALVGETLSAAEGRMGLSAWRVAFGAEPVVVGRRWRFGLGRAFGLAGRGGHGIDILVADRLLLHPQLVSMPSLGLGHHLGDEVAAQPHLPRVTPAAAGAILR